MNQVSVPTPVTIFSQRVQIHLNEAREAIAKAMVNAPVTGLNRKSLKLEFDVKVSPACWDFFEANGRDLLYLSGWEFNEFNMGDDFTIEIGITGTYESSYR
jgi:hypothetical protein